MADPMNQAGPAEAMNQAGPAAPEHPLTRINSAQGHIAELEAEIQGIDAQIAQLENSIRPMLNNSRTKKHNLNYTINLLSHLNSPIDILSAEREIESLGKQIDILDRAARAQGIEILPQIIPLQERIQELVVNIEGYRRRIENLRRQHRGGQRHMKLGVGNAVGHVEAARLDHIRQIADMVINTDLFNIDTAVNDKITSLAEKGHNITLELRQIVRARITTQLTSAKNEIKWLLHNFFLDEHNNFSIRATDCMAAYAADPAFTSVYKASASCNDVIDRIRACELSGVNQININDVKRIVLVDYTNMLFGLCEFGVNIIPNVEYRDVEVTDPHTQVKTIVKKINMTPNTILAFENYLYRYLTRRDSNALYIVCKQELGTRKAHSFISITRNVIECNLQLPAGADMQGVGFREYDDYVMLGLLCLLRSRTNNMEFTLNDRVVMCRTSMPIHVISADNYDWFRPTAVGIAAPEVSYYSPVLGNWLCKYTRSTGSSRVGFEISPAVIKARIQTHGDITCRDVLNYAYYIPDVFPVQGTKFSPARDAELAQELLKARADARRLAEEEKAREEHERAMYIKTLEELKSAGRPASNNNVKQRLELKKLIQKNAMLKQKLAELETNLDKTKSEHAELKGKIPNYNGQYKINQKEILGNLATKARTITGDIDGLKKQIKAVEDDAKAKFNFNLKTGKPLTKKAASAASSSASSLAASKRKSNKVSASSSSASSAASKRKPNNNPVLNKNNSVPGKGKRLAMNEESMEEEWEEENGN